MKMFGLNFYRITSYKGSEVSNPYRFVLLLLEELWHLDLLSYLNDIGVFNVIEQYDIIGVIGTSVVSFC